MHWLWGFSDRIKSWLPAVCVYLQRKCRQSWLHSCWFSFTRAYMYGKEKLKSLLILCVNWSFFESKHFIIPEGSSEGGWGTGSTYSCCLGANGPDWRCMARWTGAGPWEKAERSSHLQHCSESLIARSVIWWAVQIVCAAFVSLRTGDLCVTWYPVCSVTSFTQTIPVPYRGVSEFPVWWPNFKIAKKMAFMPE